MHDYLTFLRFLQCYNPILIIKLFCIKILKLLVTLIELVDETGNTVVKYLYDAWGNIIYQSDSTNVDLANKNPYRYHGYRYDNETSLYYCNSRYYDPAIGRWISADDVSYLDTSDINGLNLYCYCGNNPIMRLIQMELLGGIRLVGVGILG